VLEILTLLVVAKLATLAFGGLVTFLAFRAYRRTGESSLRALAAGMGLVTLGALLGGILHQFANFPLELAATTQSVCTALGFAVLTYSLYAERGAGRSVRVPRSDGDA
jgi:hypothetical protein